MKDKLKVSLIQAQTVWHNPEANLKNCDRLVREAEQSDLYLLPEMWSTGFTMQAEKYAHSSQEALDLMVQWAIDLDAFVSGSLIVKDGSFIYNRLYVVSKDGVQHSYDKKHLFALAGEDRIYTAGEKQLCFKIDDWKLCGNVCYDLRFPVWSRNSMDYDIAFFVANWPDKRLSAWDVLLRARAIENQAYVLGVNCQGVDVWGNNYLGHSAVLDTFGNPLTETLESEGILTAILNKDHLENARRQFPFLKDMDDFTLR